MRQTLEDISRGLPWINADQRTKVELTSVGRERLFQMRWWIGEIDEDYGRATHAAQRGSRRDLTLPESVCIGLLVTGEVALWIAMPFALFAHFSR